MRNAVKPRRSGTHLVVSRVEISAEQMLLDCEHIVDSCLGLLISMEK
jgi:hypothetical protein